MKKEASGTDLKRKEDSEKETKSSYNNLGAEQSLHHNRLVGKVVAKPYIPYGFRVTKAFSAENLTRLGKNETFGLYQASAFSRDTSVELLRKLTQSIGEVEYSFPRITIRSLVVEPPTNTFLLEISSAGRVWQKSLTKAEVKVFYNFVTTRSPYLTSCTRIPLTLLDEYPQSQILDQFTGDHLFLFLSDLLKPDIYHHDNSTGLATSILLDTDENYLELQYKLARVSFSENRSKSRSFVSSGFPARLYPSSESEARINRIYSLLYIILKNGLSMRLFKSGSTATKTYLPQEDLCFLICTNDLSQEKPWYSRFMELFCQLSVMNPTEATEFCFGSEHSFPTQISKLEFIEDLQEINLVINDVRVKIRANRIIDLYSNGVIEACDQSFARGHMFKKCLICLKWLFRNDKLGTKNTEFACVLALFQVWRSHAQNNIEQKELSMYDFIFESVQHISLWTSVFTEADQDLSLSVTTGNVRSNVEVVYEEIFALIGLPKNVFHSWSGAEYDAFCETRQILAHSAEELLYSEQFSQVLLNSLRIQGEQSGYEQEAQLAGTLSFDVRTLAQNIQYFKLVNEGQVQLKPLVTLIKEVLYEVGSLPVGEVGKMLQLHTGESNITGIIKESFGGLKKIFMQHETIFALGTDHPFNPKVYLRELLTPSDQQAISQGKSALDYANRLFGTALAEYRKRHTTLQRTGNSTVLRNARQSNKSVTISKSSESIFSDLDGLGVTANAPPSSWATSLRGVRSMENLAKRSPSPLFSTSFPKVASQTNFDVRGFGDEAESFFLGDDAGFFNFDSMR
eukprot:snap_masked-scaffold_14-processed-gene-6.38-mRNA-1 protein AED:1.00 eAED:1.00 QI:0/0/0/0/1/1/2/0/796